MSQTTSITHAVRASWALALLPMLLVSPTGARADIDAGAFDSAAPGVSAPPPVEYRIVRRYVPTLQRFTLVDLNTQQLAGRVDQGLPVRLPFASQENPRAVTNLVFQLDLRPVVDEPVGLLLYGGAGLNMGDVQWEEVSLPESRTYVGKAPQATNSLAGFSITPERVQGAAMVPLSEMGYSGWSFIEPVESLLRRNGAPPQHIARVLERYDHVVYNAAGVVTERFIDIEEPRDDQPPPDPDGHDIESPAGIVVETVSIYLMGDVDFVNDHAGDVNDAFDSQELLMLWVELITDWNEPGIYGNGEFAIDLDLTGRALWVSGGPSSTDPSTLLEQGYNEFPWSIVATPVNDIGLVHLFTGKNLDGNVIGKAWKIGGFDDACGTDYSTGNACKQSVAEWQFSSSTYYEQIILMAHEIGHNMDAVHGDHDSSYCAGALCGPTIMKSGISSSQVPYYSATNAAAIADKVDAECANDPC